VKAKDAGEAAELARENHNHYKWVHDGTAEFDARTYITLDKDGREIDETQVGDF
jgi:hypothetical protein